MITSRDRILTTHVGSLPRNETITELLIKREAGEAIDPGQMSGELDRAVAEVVKRQKECGIDIGNDGEQQRVAFQTYMAARMTGYGGEFEAPRRQGLRRASRSAGDVRPAFCSQSENLQRPAGDRRREVHRHGPDQGRDRALQDARGGRLLGKLHDGAVARHRGDHA